MHKVDGVDAVGCVDQCKVFQARRLQSAHQVFQAGQVGANRDAVNVAARVATMSTL